MKLYYAPGACSLSPHIVAREAGLPVDLIRIDTKTHKTADGDDFYRINPLGYVPFLVLDNGETLIEGPAIVQYLADQKPDTGLMPKGFERYRVASWLNFISTELHKQFSPLFGPDTPEVCKTIAKDNLAKRFAYLDGQLKGKSYLTGETFTAADAYLFVVTNWSRFHNIDLAQWPNLAAFMERVKARPAVRQAMKEEGLIQTV